MAQKGDVSAVGIHRYVYPLQHELDVSSRRRKERVFPRPIVGEHSRSNEVERWFRDYMEKEAPFLGIYRRDTKSESIVARFKRNLPVFDGFWRSEALLSWIDAIDDFFEETNPPEKFKCKIVWYKMEGRAYYWWKFLQNDRVMDGKEEISSWPKMKKLLISRFSSARCSTKLPDQLDKPEKSEELKQSMDSNPSDSYRCLDLILVTPTDKIVEDANNILEPENREEQSFDDGLEEGFVELKSAACSTKVSYKADCLVPNALAVQSASSHTLLPIYGLDPQVDVSVTTCGLAGSKPLKFSDHIWNELSYVDGSDDWKTYGLCVADRRIHHYLLQIVLEPCNVRMLYEPLIRNFDPGGSIDSARIQVSDFQFRIWQTLIGAKSWKKLLNADVPCATENASFVFDPGDVLYIEIFGNVVLISSRSWGLKKFVGNGLNAKVPDLEADFVRQIEAGFGENVHLVCIPQFILGYSNMEKGFIEYVMFLFDPSGVFHPARTQSIKMLMPVLFTSPSFFIICSSNVKYIDVASMITTLNEVWEIAEDKACYCAIVGCLPIDHRCHMAGDEQLRVIVVPLYNQIRPDSISMKVLKVFTFWHRLRGSIPASTLVVHPLKLAVVLSLNYETLAPLDASNIRYVDNSNFSGIGTCLTFYLAFFIGTYSVCRNGFNDEGHNRVEYQSRCDKNENDLTRSIEFVSLLFDPGGSAKPRNLVEHNSSSSAMPLLKGDKSKDEIGGSYSKEETFGKSTQKYDLEVNYPNYMVLIISSLGLASVWKFYTDKPIYKRDVWIQHCLYFMKSTTSSLFVRCLSVTHTEAMMSDTKLLAYTLEPAFKMARSFKGIFVSRSNQRSYMNYNVTRGRVIPWEGWNDANGSKYQGTFFMTKQSEVTFCPCLGLSIPCTVARVRLFCKMVNGLDPPTYMKVGWMALVWTLKSSLVDELFCVGGMD